MRAQQAALAALLALASCAPDTKERLDELATISLADLDAAEADALAHNDQIAAACYPALAQAVLTAQAALARPPPVGAASAFQRARDGKRGIDGGIPVYLRIGCAALVDDVRGDVLQIVKALGLIAAP